MTPDKSTRLARENRALYERAMTEGGEDYQAQARQNLNYVAGEQWTPAEVEMLGDKPDLTSNLIFGFVRTVIGLYTGSKPSIKAAPREVEYDSGRAIAVNATMDFVLDSAKYMDEEGVLFQDGVIQNRGYVDVNIAFDENFHGHVTYEAIDGMDILPEPGAKTYDPESWGWYLKLSWASLDSIQDSYGKAARDSVEQRINAAQRDWGDDGRGATRNKFAGPSGDYSYADMFYNAGDDEHKDWRVRVIERNEKVLKNRLVLVDPMTGDQVTLPVGMKQADAQARADAEGLELIKRQIKTVRQVVSAGDDVTLYEGLTSRPFYTLCPFFPFFMRGVTPGVVDQSISMQDTLNKTLSQIMAILGTTTNGGWMVEEDSLNNMDTEDLEEIGGQTGLTIEYKRGRPKPDKIQPNDVPRGIDGLSQTALSLLGQVMGLNDIDVTQLNSEPAVKAAMKRAALPFSHFFANLDRTRAMVGEKTLWFIQHYYSEPRRLKIKTKDDLGQEQDANMSVNVSDETDVTMGKYDITVEAESAFDEDDEAEFGVLMQLLDKGVAVPPEVLIKHSPISDKAAVAEAVKKAQQLSPEDEELQRRAKQLDIEQRELDLQKLKADTAHRYSEIARQNAQTAQMIAENPMVGQLAEMIQKGAWTGAQDAEQERAHNAERIGVEEQMREQAKQGLQQAAMQPGLQPPAEEAVMIEEGHV